MAVKNVSGHGVSSAAPAHHQQVQAANLKFQDAPKTATPSSKKKFPPEA